jgi:hypothetical protein
LSRMHARGPGRSPAGFVVIVGIYIILWINAKHSDRMGSDPSIALVGMVTCDTITTSACTTSYRDYYFS